MVAGALGGRKVIIMDSDKNLDAEFYKKLHAFKTNTTEVNDGDLESFARNEGEAGEASVDDSFESLNPSLDGSADEPPELSNNRKPKRIIAYSTKFLLEIFSQRKSSGDGTFKICPSLWKQLYIVMVKYSNAWIPVCYALLPDKCKKLIAKLSPQLQVKLSLKAELALFSLNPATPTPARESLFFSIS